MSCTVRVPATVTRRFRALWADNSRAGVKRDTRAARRSPVFLLRSPIFSRRTRTRKFRSWPLDRRDGRADPIAVEGRRRSKCANRRRRRSRIPLSCKYCATFASRGFHYAAEGGLLRFTCSRVFLCLIFAVLRRGDGRERWRELQLRFPISLLYFCTRVLMNLPVCGIIVSLCFPFPARHRRRV